eukprot:TRINITY_DN5283_c0_g1_i1.p1 TRINITY_DN5283_c0_g1~~TRINITY_DN5283_c0_g1_i1.p1  ORF type:complete len:900 (+),score=206.31 TRINITY_DN5283_c0_g1_i1:478-3177(+)
MAGSALTVPSTMTASHLPHTASAYKGSLSATWQPFSTKWPSVKGCVLQVASRHSWGTALKWHLARRGGFHSRSVRFGVRLRAQAEQQAETPAPAGPAGAAPQWEMTSTERDGMEKLMNIFKELGKTAEAEEGAALANAVAAARQFENEAEQQVQWQRRTLLLQGKLKGSQWDPLEGQPIPFSSFWKLALEKRVEFMEYGEHGQCVAVIMPWNAEEVGVKVEVELPLDAPPEMQELQKVVWKRHPVIQMPADAQTEMWEELRGQVVDIKFDNPMTSVWAQTMPTVELFVVWAFRLALAITVFQVTDHFMKKIYTMTPEKDWPVNPRRNLKAELNQELGSLGSSRARYISAEESTGVTFDDFAGQEYVKRELQQVVKILKEAEEYDEMGVYCPKGVLLFGPPGTGKTLLARAIAGEAGLPFFSVSGSEFVEMFVGVAVSRVKDLFARARKFAPSIIFIDEIDAIGAARGSGGSDGGNLEREQGLIQILTELDGFQTNQAKVLVIGATNRMDLLDPALLRKGRFDKTIAVNKPSSAGRLAILKVHARNKDFRSDEEKEQLLQEVAELALGFSGAELMNVLNEATILSVRNDKDYIDRDGLLEAIKRQAGEFRTGEEDQLDDKEARLRVAYRESAVALLECAFPDPHREMIMTTSTGVTPTTAMQYTAPRHRPFSRKKDMVEAIVKACAPAVVEEMVFGRDNMGYNTGIALEEAAKLTEYLLLRSGMTALGPVSYHLDVDVVPHLEAKVMALRDEYVRFAVNKCLSVLIKYRSALETLAEELLHKEAIYAEEIWKIFNSAPHLPAPEVREVDEYWALMHATRWGVHGLSLPGRATFHPGNAGWATFGAPRPQNVRRISDRAWQMVDETIATSLQNAKKKELAKEEEEEQAGEVLCIAGATSFL